MHSIQVINYPQALELVARFPISVQASLTDVLTALYSAWENFHAEPELGLITGDVETDVFELPGTFDMVFILGDITVNTFIRDTGPSDYSLLAVSGDVKADAVISLCSLVVGGTIEARRIYANSLNDGQLIVGADIVADELFFEGGQHTHCLGRLQSPLIVSTHNEIHASQGIHGVYFTSDDESFLPYFIDELIEASPEVAFDGSAWVNTGKIHRMINSDALVASLQSGRMILKTSP